MRISQEATFPLMVRLPFSFPFRYCSCIQRAFAGFWLFDIHREAATEEGMYRVLIICLASGCCEATVASAENEKVSREQIQDLDHTSPQPFVATIHDDDGQRQQPIRYFYPIYSNNGNNGYSGYNGYAFETGRYPWYPGAAAPSPQTSDPYSDSEFDTSLFPFSAEILVYGAHVGAYLLQLLFTAVLGSTFLVVICKFTPICAINFYGFGWTKNQVKEQVAELAGAYPTSQAIDAAALLISKALDKYSALQNEKRESAKRRETEKSLGGSSIG